MSTAKPSAGPAALARVIEYFTLFLISIMAFSVRLFSVIKYESVIHEFDPYFNYRVTQFLTKEGFYNLWNWFDDRTWYPLGRVVGGTVYPGLIFTAGTMYKVLHALNIPIHVQEVCVFTAPLFSAFCAIATYLLVKEARGSGAGLCAAAFVSTVPSYISRSVAGSFDNEGVAIFALVNVFWLYVKTLNTGSLFWATGLCAGYLYMVASWGGYSFIINLLPIHCLASIVTGRLTSRLYVAYSPLIVIGTLAAACIPVVGFNAVLTSEHFGSFLAFAVLHVVMAMRYLKGILPRKTYVAAKTLMVTSGVALLAVVAMLSFGWILASPTFRWTGRSLSLLDPTYASKYIPIIASVSEHQPTSWTSYFMDTHMMVLLAPAGLISAFYPLSDGTVFLILYAVTAVYFSGVMVRLMLVLAPALCCLGGIAAHDALRQAGRSFFARDEATPAPSSSSATDAADADADSDDSGDDGGSDGETDAKKRRKAKAGAGAGGKKKGGGKGGAKKPGQQRWYPWPRDVALVSSVLLFSCLAFYVIHCCWVSAEMYSAPSIVLQSRQRDGTVHIFDDFREAYAWLRHNTHPEAKVASWWDYGYQTTAMANRTVLVDNNTWNNTHIATVGRAMASPEKKAWAIYRSLDVEYVLVVFGGWIGYPSDDINKFLWMVRIGGGVFPEIQEKDYLTQYGGYKIDASASKTMLDSLMYRLSYYRFADASQMVTGRRGYDRVRNTEIGLMDFKLRHFEEVFTSQHWMVRIYRLLDEPQRDGAKLKNPYRTKGAARSSKKGSGRKA